MTTTAPPTPAEDEARLIREVRGFSDLTVGHGMGIQVSGVHLRAVLARIDHLEQRLADTPAGTVDTTPPEPSWQAALPPVLRIVDDILQNPEYADLFGVNLVDAIEAWTIRNQLALEQTVIAAVERCLSGA